MKKERLTMMLPPRNMGLMKRGLAEKVHTTRKLLGLRGAKSKHLTMKLKISLD